MHICMLMGMSTTTWTSIRVDAATRDGLKRFASEDNTTIGEALAAILRRERQRRLGQALATYDLDATDVAWLDIGAEAVRDAVG